jgi:hypothetical protein
MCYLEFINLLKYFLWIFVNCINAQSFPNSFEGVHGVVRKSGGGGPILWFIAFL